MIRTFQLTVDSPWPSTSGGDIRNAFVAQSARSAGPVHVVSFGHSNQVGKAVDISTNHIPSFADSVPWHRHYPRLRTVIQLNSEDLAFLEEEILGFAPQIAILEGVAVGAALPLFQALGIPVILDMHNIESDLYRSIRRTSSLGRYLKDLAFGSRRWNESRQFDRNASLTATETWVTSKNDRRNLLRIGGASSIVVPNPIPDQGFTNFSLHPKRYASTRAVFVGHLAYPPNVRAARELVRTIWPLIRLHEPEASLSVCGRTPTDGVLNLGTAEGVKVIGDPVDLSAIYQQCGFALMPIRQGGGTRIKVLEAMAAGTIVIATAKAIEGLGALPDIHYLQAERSADFIIKLQRCRENPDYAVALADRARKFVLGEFGTYQLANKIVSRLAHLTDMRHQVELHNVRRT
ncbi:glycosyltransferase [Mesorhizobium sp. 10J20-29]